MSTTLQQNEQNLIAKENVSGQNNLARMASGNGVPSNKPPLSLSRNQFANSRGLSNRNSTKRRWRLYPRGLYPIAEATESLKDEESTNDKEKISGSPAALSLNHLNIKRDSKTPQKPVKNCNIVSSYNLHGLNILSNRNPYDKNKNNTKANVSTNNYSACQKLMEDFQLSVTEDAVRIIQLHYRGFKLRKEFLILRKAAKTIQRYVRKWLQRKPQIHDSSEACSVISGQDLINNALCGMESLEGCKNVNNGGVKVAELAETSSDTSSGLGIDIESSFESNCSTGSSGFASESLREDLQIVECKESEVIQPCTGCILIAEMMMPVNKKDSLNDWLSDLDISARQPPPLVQEECCDIWSDDECLDVIS